MGLAKLFGTGFGPGLGQFRGLVWEQVWGAVGDKSGTGFGLSLGRLWSGSLDVYHTCMQINAGLSVMLLAQVLHYPSLSIRPLLFHSSLMDVACVTAMLDPCHHMQHLLVLF